MKNKNSGFTLIELLVVISIVAFMSTLAMVSYKSSRQRARDSKRIGDISQLAKVINIYRAEESAWPGEGDTTGTVISANCSSDFKNDLINAKYFANIPTDSVDSYSNCNGQQAGNDLSYYGWDTVNMAGGCCLTINNIETTWGADMLIARFGAMRTQGSDGTGWGGQANIDQADFVYCYTAKAGCN